MIGLGEFFIFAAVFGYFMLIVGALLVIAYQKNAYKLITILRVLLVVFTFCGFLNIFIDNMQFKDAYPNLLENFAMGRFTINSEHTGGVPINTNTTNDNNNSTGGGRLL